MPKKVYIVRIGFQETIMDYWTKDHKAFFDEEEAKLEKESVLKFYSHTPECPLPEGEDEYYDRLRVGLTAPEENELMLEWEKTLEKIRDFDSVFISVLDVH